MKAYHIASCNAVTGSHQARPRDNLGNLTEESHLLVTLLYSSHCRLAEEYIRNAISPPESLHMCHQLSVDSYPFQVSTC